MFELVRVRRARAEAVLIDLIRKNLLSPERAQRMAREMQLDCAERVRRAQARLAEHSQELRELMSRIDRPRIA